MYLTYLSALLVVLTSGAVEPKEKGSAPEATTAAHRQAEQQGRSETRDRTTARLQRMNSRQREHARIFGAEYDAGIRILDELASPSVHGVPFDDGTGESVPVTQRLAEFACRSGAVIEGTVHSSEALPVDTGRYLFTEYSFGIERILRTSPNIRTTRAGNTVIVIRPGGVIQTDDGRVSVGLESYPALSVGSKYVLFVDYIPKTQSFRTVPPVLASRGQRLNSLMAVSGVQEDLVRDGIDIAVVTGALESLRCR
jgi:hypothetical protein